MRMYLYIYIDLLGDMYTIFIWQKQNNSIHIIIYIRILICQKHPKTPFRSSWLTKFCGVVVLLSILTCSAAVSDTKIQSQCHFNGCCVSRDIIRICERVTLR